MIPEKKRRWIRLLVTVLWIAVVGILAYQNHLLQVSLQRMETRAAGLPEDADALAEEIKSLRVSIAMYAASFKREHINLKECMAKLPPAEVDDFYNRHRDALQRAHDNHSQPPTP